MRDRHRQIATADPPHRTRILCNLFPALTRVVAPVEGDVAARLIEKAVLRRARDSGKDPLRVGRRDREVRLDDARQAARQLTPGGPTVDGLENASARPSPNRVLPWALPFFPQGGVDDVGIGRIDINVIAPRVLVLVEHPLETASAVRRPKDAPLLVGSVRMPEGGDEDAVRIA